MSIVALREPAAAARAESDGAQDRSVGALGAAMAGCEVVPRQNCCRGERPHAWRHESCGLCERRIRRLYFTPQRPLDVPRPMRRVFFASEPTISARRRLSWYGSHGA